MTEVQDDRPRQGTFTISLTVKALRESHILSFVITRRIKVWDLLGHARVGQLGALLSCTTSCSLK